MIHLSQELLEPDGSQGQISLFSMVQCNLRQSAKLHGQDFRGIQDEDDPFSDNRSTCEWMQRDNGVIILKDTYSKIMRHFTLGQDLPGEWPYDAKKACIDATVTNNGSQSNACGFPVPDLMRYKVVSMEYVPMPDDLKGKMYVVTFKNKQGDVVIKLYHKTHPMAYTVQRAGEEPYTIVDTTCKKVYDTKYFGKYEVPQCVLELYSTAKIGGYLPEQFEEQKGFIKMRTPEPDDFNPYEDAPFSAGKQWIKACEWWDTSLFY